MEVLLIEPGLRSPYSDYATYWAIRGSNPGKSERFALFVMPRVVLGPAKSHIRWVLELSTGGKTAGT